MGQKSQIGHMGHSLKKQVNYQEQITKKRLFTIIIQFL